MAGAPIDYDGSAEEKAKAAGDRLYGRAEANDFRTQYAGSPWQTTYDYNMQDGSSDPYIGQGGRDARSYMYGRDPNAANAAAGLATQTGAVGGELGLQAQQHGQALGRDGNALLAQRTGDAVHFDNRAVQQGDFGAQNQSLSALGGLEATQGPSAAQAQLQSGTNQAMASQLAMARSGRGLGGNAAAMGQAQGNMAGIQANQANQAAGLRAQEDAAWRGRQASNLTNVAGMQGQQSQANLGAAVQGRSQNDAMTQGMLGMGQNAWQYGGDAAMQGYGMGLQGVQTSLAGQGLANDVRGQEMQGGMAQEDNALRYVAAKNGWELGQAQQQQSETAGYLAAAGAGLSMLSDVRAKKDIVPSDKPALDFARAGSMVDLKQPDTGALDAAAAAPGSSYQYIDPGEPGAKPGTQYGPMAQDLAKTPAGSTAVVKQPDGQLGIDPARLTTLNTSAISAQQRQLDEIQGMLRQYGAPKLSTRESPY